MVLCNTWNSESRRQPYVLTIQKGVYERLASLGFQIDRHYTSGNLGHEDYYYDGSPIPSSVKALFVDEQTATNSIINDTTDGRLFIGHRDHGDFDGWVHPPFTIANLNTINTTIPSVFYSINCLTGTFGSNPPPALQDCFAEILLKMKGVAPSVIAATDLSDTFLNDDLIEGLFDATFGGVIPTFPGSTASYPVTHYRIGDILNYAKFYLPVADPTRDIKSEFEIYHVLGDPTLEIWTAQPQEVTLLATLREDMIDIKMSQCPNDSVVTIWYRGKLLKKLQPSSNLFSVSLRGLITRPHLPLPRPILPLIVCFKAPGYHFAQTNVKIVLQP